MKYSFSQKKTVVFSKWSRKKFAIFASLGKLVKIGRVSADICDKALQKTSELTGLSNKTESIKKGQTDTLEDISLIEDVPDGLPVLPILSPLCFLTPVVSVQEGNDPKQRPLSITQAQAQHFLLHGLFLFFLQ